MGALFAAVKGFMATPGFGMMAGEGLEFGLKAKLGGKAGATLASHLAMNLAVPVITSMAFAPRGEKLNHGVSALGFGMLMMGMPMWKQMAGQVALGIAPHVGDFVRAVASTNRNAMEARTMAAIPFSYSAQSMDVAQSNYQAARQRLNQNYSLIGNEAAFYSAKYLSR